MNLWVMGPGPSSLEYKKHIKKLNGKNVLALHRVYPHTIDHFSIVPKYWTWFDPGAAIYGLETLSKHIDRGANPKAIQIILPDFLCSQTRQEYLKHSGGSGPWSEADKHWNIYLRKVSTLVEKGVEVNIIPATSTKEISENKERYADLIDNFLDPKTRFEHEKMIVGTGLSFESYFKRPGTHWDCLENKLTSLMLPIAHKMRAKNVFIVGFDGIGGRFHNPSNLAKDSSYESKIVHGGINPNDGKKKACASYHNLSYLKHWNDWTEYTGMKIWSVVEDKFCETNQFTNYMPIEEAMEMGDE